MKRLAATLNPAHTPGTIFFEDGRVQINPPTQELTDFETLPTPLFPHDVQQWCPDIVRPLYTMSNCPMKCKFCAISAGSDSFLSTPRAMSPQHIALHMKELRTERFDIFDETFSVKRQLVVGEELRKINHSATWNCYMIVTDELLDPEVCQKLYAAGCRGVQLGLESLSPETLKTESKGWNHPQNYGRILQNLREAGIQTHVFLITGIPGEPLHWSLKWLDFMEKYGDSVLTIKSSRYRLTKSSPEERVADKSNLISPVLDTKPFHLNRDFCYSDSSRKKVEAMRDILEQMCHEHWAYEVTSSIPWWVNRGRFTWDQLRTMASELSRHTALENVPHLQNVVRRMGGIVKGELGQNVQFSTFENVRQFARTMT